MPTLAGGVNVSVTVGGEIHFTIWGGVAVSVTVGGGLYPSIYGGVDISPTVGGTLVAPTARMLPGGIGASVTVGGIFIILRAPTTTPEGRREQLGYLPTAPLVVFNDNVKTELELTDTILPNDGNFLMSAVYIPQAADGLYDTGALPGHIGTLYVKDLVTYRIFRAPLENEVVWYTEYTGTSGYESMTLEEYVVLTLEDYDAMALWDVIGEHIDHGLLRWDGTVWKAYESVPERALMGMQLFDTLDPDGVYRFYMRLLGAMLIGLIRDNKSLLNLFDPDKCPVAFLPALIEQTGAYMPASITDMEVSEVRRRALTAVTRSLLAGTPALASLQLAIMGYSGYMYEVWVNPDAATNWTDYADAPAAVKSDIVERGLLDEIADDSGEKGQDWFEAPHGYFMEHPAGYYLSSRVVVHVNLALGASLDPGLGQGPADTLKQTIATEFALEVLPAKMDIRMFVTDFAVDSAGGVYDNAEVSDSMSLVEV